VSSRDFKRDRYPEWHASMHNWNKFQRSINLLNDHAVYWNRCVAHDLVACKVNCTLFRSGEYLIFVRARKYGNRAMRSLWRNDNTRIVYNHVRAIWYSIDFTWLSILITMNWHVYIFPSGIDTPSFAELQSYQELRFNSRFTWKSVAKNWAIDNTSAKYFSWVFRCRYGRIRKH